MAPSRKFVPTLSCPDREGIGSMLSGLLYQAGCDSIDSQQLGDVGRCNTACR
jgi:formyltetrahydrofolate deformylase